MDIDAETQKQLTKMGTEAIQQISGGAVKELNMVLGQNVAYWRFINLLKIAIKARDLLKEKGINPQQLPPQLRDIVPILEHASMEDDHNLQRMWASLLASYATPDFSEGLQPKFHEILRQLSPSEATILKHFYDGKFLSKNPNYDYLASLPLSSRLNMKHDDIISFALNLMRLSLIHGQEVFEEGELAEVTSMSLTPIGVRLIERCTYFESDADETVGRT